MPVIAIGIEFRHDLAELFFQVAHLPVSFVLCGRVVPGLRTHVTDANPIVVDVAFVLRLPPVIPPVLVVGLCTPMVVPLPLPAPVVPLPLPSSSLCWL